MAGRGTLAGRRFLLPFVLSLLILIPCFWHRRIEAGDLGSHLYNAWLVTLVEKGQVPDLYVAPQWHNVAVDILLTNFGRWFGFRAAEKIVMSVCVLVFFWGAFGLISSVSKQRPWFLTPALAMIAYGYTLEMGFLNYYLSLGLAFVALSLAMQRTRSGWIGAAFLAVLVFLAHPVGLLMLAGMAAYFEVARVTRGWVRWLPPAVALSSVLGLSFWLAHFRVAVYETKIFYLFNGADQVMLFGKRYMMLFFLLAAFLGFAMVRGLKQAWLSERRSLVRAPFELWLVMLLAAAAIPELIFLPQYPAPLALFVSRGTCLSAVFLLCMLGALKPQIWHLAGFLIFAALFFSWLYQDTGELNAMEAQAERLVDQLPFGTRVVGTMGPPPGSRIVFIEHMLDRACIGRCFTYADYEPPSGQFRIRVRPGARWMIDSAESVGQIEFGQYVVKPRDLPLKQVYQCRVEDLQKLCVRDLRAGEKNCPDCNNPFYWLLHASPK